MERGVIKNYSITNEMRQMELSFNLIIDKMFTQIEDLTTFLFKIHRIGEMGGKNSNVVIDINDRNEFYDDFKKMLINYKNLKNIGSRYFKLTTRSLFIPSDFMEKLYKGLIFISTYAIAMDRNDAFIRNNFIEICEDSRAISKNHKMIIEEQITFNYLMISYKNVFAKLYSEDRKNHCYKKILAVYNEGMRSGLFTISNEGLEVTQHKKFYDSYEDFFEAALYTTSRMGMIEEREKNMAEIMYSFEVSKSNKKYEDKRYREVKKASTGGMIAYIKAKTKSDTNSHML